VLVALLVSEGLPEEIRPPCFTTEYFCFRACRAVVNGATGRVSGPFERLDPGRRGRAIHSMLALPDDVGLPDPRSLGPVMVEIHGRHPHLNVLNTEATAAAVSLRATVALTRTSADGQLGKALVAEQVPFVTVDLP